MKKKKVRRRTSILEGLCGDAFLLARDVELDALTNAEGLEELLQKMKASTRHQGGERLVPRWTKARRPLGPPEGRIQVVFPSPAQA